MSSDIVDLLRRIGLCAPHEALLALLTHATKSRLSPYPSEEGSPQRLDIGART